MVQKIIVFAIIASIIIPVIIAKNSSFKKVTQREIPLEKETVSGIPKDKIEIETSFYYTPEPDQDFYLNGSYEKEVEMNGTGKTYSGVKAKPGIVAADLKVFPLGTIFRVLDEDIKKLIGQEIYVVGDTGSAIKAKLVDFHTGKGSKGLKKALKIEKHRKVKIEIIEWGG